jgi:hypothetical protein
VANRFWARFAWSLWALSLASAAVGVAFGLSNSSSTAPESQDPAILGILSLLVFVAFVTVGALVASRRPGNMVGWIFCALGLCGTLAVASEGYAVYALVTRPGSLPEGEGLVWLSGLLGGPITFAMFALVLLLFPDGRLLSPRWWPFIWLDLIAVALIFAFAFKPGPIENSPLDVANPFGIGDAGTLLDTLGGAGIFLALAATVAGAVSLVLRLRRSQGDERQQLKWFAFAGAVCCAAFATGPALWSLPPSSGLAWIWTALFLSATSTIPAATGIAMLKYRLYDIDVVINKTLVYGSLTATLALVYLGGVISLQSTFRTLTGGGSQLAIVASTLIIAALFNPFRKRIQRFIDRRFYRGKYDAQKTLEEFGAQLRDETDLDALGDELARVIRETVQPAHVSLWLRPPATGGRPKAEN